MLYFSYPKEDLQFSLPFYYDVILYFSNIFFYSQFHGYSCLKIFKKAHDNSDKNFFHSFFL